MGGKAWTALAVITAALSAAPAQAQLPSVPSVPGIPPIGGGPGTPPQQPGPGRPNGPGITHGEAVSYRGNPAHTGVASSEAVFGPLVRAWTRLPGGIVNQPLIVGGKVIVNVARASSGGYGSRLVAFDAASGRRAWKRETPGTYYQAPIAANSGRVFSVNWEGVVRAFGVRDGRRLWTVDLGGQSFQAPPVAAAGTVFVYGDDTLHALSASTGAVRWRRSLEIEFGGWPTLDDRRVFLVGDCDAVAVAQTSGAVLWRRDSTRDDCYGPPTAFVHGGRLFTSDIRGRTYDAASGADRRALPGEEMTAAAGGLGYRPSAVAVRLDDGRVRWRFRDPSPQGDDADARPPPLVVGPTLYLIGPSGRLYGLNRFTGRVLSATRGARSYTHYTAGTIPGMAGGAGLLVITGGDRLIAYRSLLTPGPRGIDIASTGFDVFSGQRVSVVAGLGRRLRRETRKVRLAFDDHPFRGFSTTRAFRTEVDGTAYATMRVLRNRRVRFAARGRKSPAVTIYARPRAKTRVRRVSRSRGRLTVRMRSPDRRFRVGGRRIVLYLGRWGKRRYERLGVGRVRQTGRGRATGRVGFRLLDSVGRRDTVAWCVRGLTRLGYGRTDGFERRCGRRRISFRAANARR